MPEKIPASPENAAKLPAVEVIAEEHKPEEQIEVQVGPKQETPAPDATDKLKNQTFYEMRQMEKRLKLQQEQFLSDLAQRLTGNQAQPQKGPEKLDDFDEEVERVAQTDWRKGVSMLAAKQANELFEKKMKEQEEFRKQEDAKQNMARLEAKGKSKLLSEFPEAANDETPVAKTFMEIYEREIAEDPMFLYNPRKYDIILPELREKLGSKKVSVVDNAEVERLKRVAVGVPTPSRPSSKSETIMLTQSEIELCKRSGIPYATYAATKKLGNAGLKEGMVMDE